MSEECRLITKKDYALITKEEFDKYVDNKNCCADNERLRIENAELREQLELLQECVPPYSLERIMIEVRKEKLNEPEVEKSKIDWDYVIKNKCVCRFWDSGSEEVLSCDFRYLKEVNYAREAAPYEDEFGYLWAKCRPVRKNEIEFYEDRKDKEE